MGIRTITVILTTACLCLLTRAQQAPNAEQLQQQLQKLQRQFEQEQAEHRRQLQALQEQIDLLRGSATNSPSAVAVAPPQPPATPASATNSSPSWSPSDPVRIAGGNKSYLNLSLDGLFAAGGSTASDIEALEPGGHDPKVNGFTVQNLELTLEGAVDPYFKGQANLLFQIDSSGESRTELEEAYLTSVALPANLQLKAGQFFTEFGRLNTSHPHAWAFVDQPLVNGRLFGADGLRNPGARLSWLVPTPFYSELYFAVQNSHGETAYSFRQDHGGELLFGRPTDLGEVDHFTDLLLTPRYALSFDLTDTQTLLMGASGAFGPNGTGESERTEVYGLDLFWKWKPANSQGGFPFVSWQTEGMLRRFEAAAYDGLIDPANPTPALPAENLLDYGFYSQVAYGFRHGWVAALRGDWVSGDTGAFAPDPDRATRWRISPNLTWYPSEFSKIRVQYNYDDRELDGVDHSVWLQMEFLLGAHAAHRF